MTRSSRLFAAIAIGLGCPITALASDPPPIRETAAKSHLENDATNLADAQKSCPWGEPVDGIACRLVVQPHYVIGQAITAVMELKNDSKNKRYIITNFDPNDTEYTLISISGPQGELSQSRLSLGRGQLWKDAFESIDAGQIKRFEIFDLRSYFSELDPSFPRSKVRPGKYSLRFRFTSPTIPARLIKSINVGLKSTNYQNTPPEWLAGQWAHEIVSPQVTFDLLPLTKNDLVVHEWGVFALFNDSKYANANRKEEWASLPSFFYSQFAPERLPLHPAKWLKPIVYFYANQTPLQLEATLSFAEGAPVVWWPAVYDPGDRGFPSDSRDVRKPRPYRELTWRPWLGHSIPNPDREAGRYYDPKSSAWIKVKDFELPANSWIREARLPGASPLTVLGNRVRNLRSLLDRQQTERFLYYDGLVPTPDSLRCERVDAASVILRNRARFDITNLFVVDRRTPGKVGFASLDGKEKTLKAGTTTTVPLHEVPPENWPQVGLKQVKQALLDAGLFEPDCDAFLRIWRSGLLEADGLTAFYLLPQDEYDRMLPLKIVPAPPAKPTRVGMVLHPHLEIEPELAVRVAALIRDLDDSAFNTRVAAGKALREMGPFAIGMLQAELNRNPSSEKRRRIQEILEQIDAGAWLDLPGQKKK